MLTKFPVGQLWTCGWRGNIEAGSEVGFWARAVPGSTHQSAGVLLCVPTADWTCRRCAVGAHRPPAQRFITGPGRNSQSAGNSARAP
jgi:hypothetical protein